MNKSIFFSLFLIVENLSAEEKGGMPQLNPESFTSQIFWLFILFALLFFFNHYLFLPKLKNIRKKRDEKIESYLIQAKQINESVNKIVEKMQKEFEDAKSEQNSTLKKTFDVNKEILDKKVLEINEDFEQKKDKLNSQINSNKKAILSDLPDICVRLSDILYEKIMGSKSKGSIKDFNKLFGDK